jgi:hypothetical protein
MKSYLLANINELNGAILVGKETDLMHRWREIEINSERQRENKRQYTACEFGEQQTVTMTNPAPAYVETQVRDVIVF